MLQKQFIYVYIVWFHSVIPYPEFSMIDRTQLKALFNKTKFQYEKVPTLMNLIYLTRF